MVVLFKHACLLASVGGLAMWKRARQCIRPSLRADTSLTALITVVHPRLELPRSPPLLLGVSRLKAQGQQWHSRNGRHEQGGRRWQLGVEKGVTPALGGGSPPAVPIWGEKRSRGSSISSRSSPGPESPMAAAEQKHTLPLFQHQRPSTLNYFSGEEVFGQWTQPRSTDLDFTQVFSWSQRNKLLEKRALELYLKSFWWPRPWELFTACFSLIQAPDREQCQACTLLRVLHHWKSNQSRKSYLNSKCLLQCTPVQRSWSSINNISTDVLIVKQLSETILSKHSNCRRTKVSWDSFIEKDRVNIKVRHALRSSSPPWVLDSFTSGCFFSQNETQHVPILEDETHCSGRKKNNRKSQLANGVSVAHWPTSLLITTVVYASHPPVLTVRPLPP